MVNFNFEGLQSMVVKPYFSITVFKEGDTFVSIEHMTDNCTQGKTAFEALERLVCCIGIDIGEIPVEWAEEVTYEDSIG